MIDIPQLIELYGLPGLIIGGLAWAYMAERKERIKAQETERLTWEKWYIAITELTAAIKGGRGQ